MNQILNLNFAGYTGSKNLVQTRQKFQFIKLNFSNSIFQKSSKDRYRAWIMKNSQEVEKKNYQKENSLVATKFTCPPTIAKSLFPLETTNPVHP